MDTDASMIGSQFNSGQLSPASAAGYAGTPQSSNHMNANDTQEASSDLLKMLLAQVSELRAQNQAQQTAEASYAARRQELERLYEAKVREIELAAEAAQRTHTNNQQASPTTPAPHTNPAAAETPAREAPPHIPRAILGNPERFNGDRADFQAFLSAMNGKLSVDMQCHSDFVRYEYYKSRLQGEPARNVTTWERAQKLAGKWHKEESKVDAIIARLKVTYENRDEQRKALNQLKTLSQGTYSFRAYYAKYEKLIVEAGGWEWAPEIKKQYLENGLSRELRMAMVSVEEPANIDEYISVLHSTAIKLEYAQGKHTGRTSRVPASQPSHTTTADKMDWEPTAAQIATALAAIQASQASSKSFSRSARHTTKVAATTTQPSKTKSSLSTKKRAVWVTQAEMDRRKKEGLCLRCGKDGHVIRGCSLLAAINPNKDKDVKVHFVTDTADESEESESEEEESLTGED